MTKYSYVMELIIMSTFEENVIKFTFHFKSCCEKSEREKMIRCGWISVNNGDWISRHREGKEVDVNGQMSMEEGSCMKHWGLFFCPLVLGMNRRHDLKVHKLSTVGNYSK